MLFHMSLIMRLVLYFECDVKINDIALYIWPNRKSPTHPTVPFVEILLSGAIHTCEQVGLS